MKKNVIIVILVILVLGMGGYLVYDKVIDKDVEEESNTEKVENSNSGSEQLKNYNMDKIKNIVIDIPVDSSDGPEKKSITIEDKNEIKEVLLNVDDTKEIGTISDFGYSSNVSITINYNDDPSTLIIILDSGNIVVNSTVGVDESVYSEYEINNKNLSSELINKYKN